jgi:hypothetical protein
MKLKHKFAEMTPEKRPQDPYTNGTGLRFQRKALGVFMGRSFVPSIAPSGDDQTVYLVINNFGNLGTAFPETDVDKADLETIIGDLMSGQYSDPVCVVAFNTAEQWAADVSQDVAHEIAPALILRAMIWRHRLRSSSRRTSVLWPPISIRAMRQRPPTEAA